MFVVYVRACHTCAWYAYIHTYTLYEGSELLVKSFDHRERCDNMVVCEFLVLIHIYACQADAFLVEFLRRLRAHSKSGWCDEHIMCAGMSLRNEGRFMYCLLAALQVLSLSCDDKHEGHA